MTALTSTAAVGGEHYVEVWNPPEARGQRPAVPVHVRKSPKKRHVSMKTLPSAAKHSVGKVPAHGQSATARRIDMPPTFDDIPRRITPEGNILRVSHGSASAQMQH